MSDNTEAGAFFRPVLDALTNSTTTNNTAATTTATTTATTPLDDAADLASHNLLATILSNVFLFILIFGLSATVQMDALRHQLNNRLALGIGVAMQFIMMPFLGFLAVLLLNGNDFTPAMGMTLLVVTSSPGGSYSNWWCSLFNAELPLSVAMTAVSTVLSVGMLPANLVLYSYLAYGGGNETNNDDENDDENNIVAALDFPTLFISLGIVMSGIGLGLCCSYYNSSKSSSPPVIFHKWCHRAANISGIALILVSVLLSSVGVETNFWNQPWEFYVGVSFPCLVGLLISNIVSRAAAGKQVLTKPECVAISIECCYQNTGIATSVAVTMFSDPEIRAQAVAVPLLYGIVEALVIGIYCVAAWKAGWTRAPASDKLCTVVSNSYEGTNDGNDKENNNDEEAGSRTNDEDDLHVIHEESSPRWRFSLWKKRPEGAEFGHVRSSRAVMEACNSGNTGNNTCTTANRNRLVSEDNTVATGISSSNTTPSRYLTTMTSDIDKDHAVPS
mmetsp:Transcript_6771/g.11222  ORF Transcript_6771/g.11222 Transcript_6771/m.11222 type:complete len:503 (+) Transcript_6771:241-1749(+)|eukprot:CAMPEP_0119003010 /NCGR_PEP_ID=MMETSP1176-20130426/291_1 /TAXON_ID=265551 /ORGANISM="Synedropsis recta cf, Strain CCMP1620" /LENGTH=502 /DNA_ID=CAMNT_0006954563 /DNA_START=194 /DNA_END=1702 /DNA_ORIENTATION=+